MSPRLNHRNHLLDQYPCLQLVRIIQWCLWVTEKNSSKKRVISFTTMLHSCRSRQFPSMFISIGTARPACNACINATISQGEKVNCQRLKQLSSMALIDLALVVRIRILQPLYKSYIIFGRLHFLNQQAYESISISSCDLHKIYY